MKETAQTAAKAETIFTIKIYCQGVLFISASLCCDLFLSRIFHPSTFSSALAPVSGSQN